ncbi:MAG: protein tyrosine phosphatase [Deltaproteobacteria bacterium]|nr:protein tyrosine phosphatase [Deltaproteobacteria bacterium]
MRRLGSVWIRSIAAIAIVAAVLAAGVRRATAAELDAELEALRIARDGLRAAVAFTRSAVPADAEARTRLLTRDENVDLWRAWSMVLGAEAALDQLRGSGAEANGAGRFALTGGSFLAGYRYALEFIAVVRRLPSLDVILDEEVPEMGLPAGTYGRFKFRFLNVARATEFAAIEALRTSERRLSGPTASAMEEDAAALWKMGLGKGPAMTLENAAAVVRSAALAAWFPAQKGVAEWIGDVRVLRTGVNLISSEKIRGLAARLQPGDILFERREWYLSNLGLPGFWTHAALYVGTPAERAALFRRDPDTARWVTDQGFSDGDFEHLLQARYPVAHAASLREEHGAPPRILEAVSQGVIFTTIEHSAGADSLGVLRPNLPFVARAQALERAFHCAGRPYDFNSDFDTDSSLVCSELVYKAYEPAPGRPGVRFPVSRVLGRTVSTPNEMVRALSAEWEGPTPQCTFVLFLDGIEKERRALEASPAEFAKSWRRPNWHILLQAAPKESRGSR